MAASPAKSGSNCPSWVKHPLGLLEGATENAAVVQALLDNLAGTNELASWYA